MLAFTSIRRLTRLEATIFTGRTAQRTTHLTSSIVDLHCYWHGYDGLGIDPYNAFGSHGRGHHDGGRLDHGSGRLKPNDWSVIRGHCHRAGRGGDHMVQPLTSFDLG